MKPVFVTTPDDIITLIVLGICGLFMVFLALVWIGVKIEDLFDKWRKK